MYYSTSEFIDYLKEKSVRYSQIHEAPGSDKPDVVDIGFTEKNTKIGIRIFFDSDEKRATLQAFNLLKVPTEKIPAMLTAANAANGKYRYIKFFVDTDHEAVHATIDCIFRRFEIGEICFEAMARLVNVCNDVYPELAKVVEP